MPDQPTPQIKPPEVEDHPVRCRECDHVFSHYTYKVVPTTKEITLLMDADGDVVYELVKPCGKCKVVFHYHSSDKAIRANTAAFERLMSHYPRRSAIIADDNQTG